MIEEERFECLIKHLEKLEKLTGYKLRVLARGWDSSCPILSFAPEQSKEFGAFSHVDINGKGYVYYEGGKYHVFSKQDSDWWVNLTLTKRTEYTNKVMQWLKERKG